MLRPFLTLVLAAALAAAPVDFNRDIRPILSDNCFACHGPDEKARMAGLRLDTKDGAFARNQDGKAYIAPADPDASLLIQRINHANKAMRMPPAATGRILNEKQIDTIRRWIQEGASWNTHWSYVAPLHRDPPAVKLKSWPRNPIDPFVLARLDKEGLKPSPEADRATLLRRVSLDLTGLPPTPDDLDAFLKDRSPDAYQKQVDRLLSSPHYGEKLAMLWLDLARYADTHGYHIDSHRDMWPWRKWVIDAFNQNMPFDRFILEQIAGDLLPDAGLSQRIATGFHRNHMINFEGGAIPDEYQTEYVVDRVETTGTVFLGMAIGCARCHDHKYDPVSQRDFYRMFAFFNTVPEKGLDGQRGNAAPFLNVSEIGQQIELDQIDCRLRDLADLVDDKQIERAQTRWETSLAASTPALVTGGLTAHYEFDGSLSDSSGHYRHGRSASSDPAFTAGIIARALSLNVEDRILLGSGLLGPRFTLAFWIRPTHERTVRVFEQGRDIEIYTGPSANVPAYKRGAPMFFRFGAALVRSKEPLLFGSWTHVALGYDGSGFSLYFNGKPAELEILNQGPLSLASNAQLSIHDMQGQLDDLRIYGRPLSPEEVAQLGIHLPPVVAVQTPAGKRSREERDRLREYFLTHAVPEPWRSLYAERKQLEARREHLGLVLPTVMVMSDMEKPRDSFVLSRGDYRNKTDKVTPGVPAALPPLPPGAPANRLGLARWLTDPSHPLTARVAVNRFWQVCFGNGIVKTSEDFGSQGEAPSHPELLDWLATEFIRTGWDVKALQRLMVTSATYRQSSRVRPELRERDPENRLLARMSRFRLPAEIVRDNALSTSGLLNPEIGGRSVFPYQPAGLWDEMAFGREFTAQRYTPSSGSDLYRRSMYTFWKRTVPPAQMITFDAPDREKCTSRRPVTNTPLQALVLMNDPTYLESARLLAQRAIRFVPAADQRFAWLYRQVLLRKPAPGELAVLRDALARQSAVYAKDASAARKLLANGESKYDTQIDVAELAAWTNVATMILNLDETITKE